MKNKNGKKFVLTAIITISIVLLFPTPHVSAWDSTQPWTSQTTGCVAVSGNINQELDYVYLGTGSSVPSNISSTYPQASASYLEAWKTDMLNMFIFEFRSFVLSPSEGYTSGQLAGKSLFFEATILKIWNNDGTNQTSRNSVVNVNYSLYTDCAPQSSTASQTSSSSTGSSSATTVTITITGTNYVSTNSGSTSQATTTKTTLPTSPGGLAESTIFGMLALALLLRMKRK